MKKVLLFFLIFSMIFTTGCWDLIEIDNRIFPYTVGIDLNDGEEDGVFNISFSYPNIRAIGKNASSDEKVFMISTKADSIFHATHGLSNRIQQPIYLKHLKVLLISEDVAKDSRFMKQIIDGLSRDFVINNMINLLVVKGSAEEIIATKMKATMQESIEGVLYSLLRNEQSSTMFTPKTLNDFIGDIDISSASWLPVAAGLENEILLSGGGVFKDYELIGYIDEMENRDLSILNGEASRDGVDIEYKGDNLSLLITDIDSKKELTNEEELKIQYSMEIEGQIHQYTIVDESKEESEKDIHDMERAVEKSLEKDIKGTIQKVQKELRADILGIGEYLYKFHPNLWKSIEEDWDEIFPNIDIEVDVTMHIRRRGLVR